MPENPRTEHASSKPIKYTTAKIISCLEPQIPNDYMPQMKKAYNKLLLKGYGLPETLFGKGPGSIHFLEKKQQTDENKCITGEKIRQLVFEDENHNKITKLVEKHISKIKNKDIVINKKTGKPINSQIWDKLREINQKKSAEHTRFWAEFSSHKLKAEHGIDLEPEIIHRMAERKIGENCTAGKNPTLQTLDELVDEYHNMNRQQEEYKKQMKKKPAKTNPENKGALGWLRGASRLRELPYHKSGNRGDQRKLKLE
ncbi:MAG: hypothetical protein WC408_01840 [Candidatus Micrarchaeia archaeon]